MDIADEIPNLEGEICEQVLCCEEFYGESHVGNFGLLVKVSKGQWHCVFFDYGPLFWKQWDVLPDYEITISLHSRVFEVSAGLNIVGQEVKKVGLVEMGSIREVHFIFGNEVQIKIVHDSKVWEKQNCYYRHIESEDWKPLFVVEALTDSIPQPEN